MRSLVRGAPGYGRALGIVFLLALGLLLKPGILSFLAPTSLWIWSININMDSTHLEVPINVDDYISSDVDDSNSDNESCSVTNVEGDGRSHTNTTAATTTTTTDTTHDLTPPVVPLDDLVDNAQGPGTSAVRDSGPKSDEAAPAVATSIVPRFASGDVIDAKNTLASRQSNVNAVPTSDHHFYKRIHGLEQGSPPSLRLESEAAGAAAAAAALLPSLAVPSSANNNTPTRIVLPAIPSTQSVVSYEPVFADAQVMEEGNLMHHSPLPVQSLPSSSPLGQNAAMATTTTASLGAVGSKTIRIRWMLLGLLFVVVIAVTLLATVCGSGRCRRSVNRSSPQAVASSSSSSPSTTPPTVAPQSPVPLTPTTNPTTTGLIVVPTEGPTLSPSSVPSSRQLSYQPSFLATTMPNAPVSPPPVNTFPPWGQFTTPAPIITLAQSLPPFQNASTGTSNGNTDPLATVAFVDAGLVVGIVTPTALAFGPDGKLYIGTLDGTLSRVTLNDSYDTVISNVTAIINASRAILGIAFDPLETAKLGDDVSVYIATSMLYTAGAQTSSGNAVNGKIQRVQGPNLDVITDVVTGLPVSATDHAVNGIYFGDNGELYIPVGSNTNAGISDGEVTTSATAGRQENYFSAAVLVAHMGRPAFDGFLTYNSNDNPVSGFGANGVEVFAAGTRNIFGLTFTAIGKLYGMDNGANSGSGYGSASTGCAENDISDDSPYQDDKVLLLKRGEYYGHPNRKRGENDTRQCVWRSNYEASGNGYTAPLIVVPSASGGLIEYDADYFGGQMRGDLIVAKFQGALFRVPLSPDGESAGSAIYLAGEDGLAVVQAPDGSLIDARFNNGECHAFKPQDAAVVGLDIKAIFPRRGPLAGGSTLLIFGVNFTGSSTASVTVGGNTCLDVILNSATKISCTLPAGTVGRKDVTVTVGTSSDTFAQGYRYITGLPAESS